MEPDDRLVDYIAVNKLGIVGNIGKDQERRAAELYLAGLSEDRQEEVRAESDAFWGIGP